MFEDGFSGAEGNDLDAPQRAVEARLGNMRVNPADQFGEGSCAIGIESAGGISHKPGKASQEAEIEMNSYVAQGVV